MDTAALLTTLIGYPLALCVFAFLVFVVVRTAMRSALREHRAALVEELGRLQAAAAAPGLTATVPAQELTATVAAEQLATTVPTQELTTTADVPDAEAPTLPLRDDGPQTAAA